MQSLSFINKIHLPSYFVALVLYVIGTFTLAQDGQVLDLSTDQGRMTAAGILLGVVIRALQASPVTPTVTTAP